MWRCLLLDTWRGSLTSLKRNIKNCIAFVFTVCDGLSDTEFQNVHNIFKFIQKHKITFIH